MLVFQECAYLHHPGGRGFLAGKADNEAVQETQAIRLRMGNKKIPDVIYSISPHINN